MKRARFQAEMDLDDDSEFTRRRPPAPTYRSRRPPPCSRDRIPGFFGLPVELKQQIYCLVLDSDRVEPPSAPYLGDHQSSPGEIKYPAHYKSWRWPLAHWASRTFRNDLLDIAEDRLGKRQVKAELDIMVNGFVFFPTWLYLPPDLPGDKPFDLDVSLRIFSGEAFRSNDSWPRQPGSGFRVLLKLLNQLVHEGPSFGQHFEILAGKATWVINTLRINVTFHDSYTPATHEETSHEIFRMLKTLATSGLPHKVVKTIVAHASYDSPSGFNDGKVQWDSFWPVAAQVNDTQVQQWRQMGFLSTLQRTFADDYRAPWDNGSGGRPPHAQKLISPLERRDSPVGIIAPAGKNPQMDDYGPITPPTPRASAGREITPTTVSKRRSTPQAPSLLVENGDLSSQLDDYSAVMTPNYNGLLDDYSIAMTPVPSGPIDQGSDSGI